MIIIHHRINTLEQLRAVPVTDGVEIDVRYHNDELVLHHDPFGHHRQPLTTLPDYLQQWQHRGPLILNLKTEGIEAACIELMARHSVASWFFLDMSMPYLVRYAHGLAGDSGADFGPENLAVRYSEYEAREYALGFSGKAGWVWVDCFSGCPIDEHVLQEFRQAGFRTCLVSPELQGHDPDLIADFRRRGGAAIDAVCTKYPALWEQE